MDPTQQTSMVEFVAASASYGSRVLWENLSGSIANSSFTTILGPNGAGKTTLLKILLGQLPLSGGKIYLAGKPLNLANKLKTRQLIGYIPQQKTLPNLSTIRAKDLVALGIDGQNWGFRWLNRQKHQLVDNFLKAVGASKYANVPISMLSGGEQQRLRIAQALISKPKILLCDEPLLSIDLHSQREIAALINKIRQEYQLTVLFVTHEINPVLPYTDQVLYLAGKSAKLGLPQDVLRSEVLSNLYGHQVEVLNHHGRLVVLSDSEVNPIVSHF